MSDNIERSNAEDPAAPVSDYEPSTELKQTDLAEGELETVEECLREHERADQAKLGSESLRNSETNKDDLTKRLGVRNPTIDPQREADRRMGSETRNPRR